MHTPSTIRGNAPGSPVLLRTCRNGELIALPAGLTGLDVFTVLHLLRIGFGSDVGDEFVGSRAFIHDAGVDPATGASLLRVVADSTWRNPAGTRTTTNEIVQVLLYLRADFASDSEDSLARDAG